MADEKKIKHIGIDEDIEVLENDIIIFRNGQWTKGNQSIHVGSDEPQDIGQLWVDTSDESADAILTSDLAKDIRDTVTNLKKQYENLQFGANYELDAGYFGDKLPGIDFLIAPTLSIDSTVSNLNAATYYVQYTWLDSVGESLSSPEANITLANGESIVVTLPTFPDGIISANIYISTESGAETLQGNTTTATYTRTSRLVDGDPVPKQATDPNAPNYGKSPGTGNIKRVVVKRGLKKDLGGLQEGELGFCIDTEELYIGNKGGLKLIAKVGGVGGGSGSGGNVTGDYVELVSESGAKYRLTVNSSGETMILNSAYETAAPPDPTKDAPKYAKLIVNKVYGGGDINKNIAPVSHSFIELYNYDMVPMNLTGLSLQYKEPGKDWQVFPLKGTINPHSSFLIRGAQHSDIYLDTTRVKILDYDLGWDNLAISCNMGYSVYLKVGTDKCKYTNPANIDNSNLWTINTRESGYINMFAAAPKSIYLDVDAYETKAMHATDINTMMLRNYGQVSTDVTVTFSNTFNNSTDIIPIDVRSMPLDVYTPRSSRYGKWDHNYNQLKLDQFVPNVINICFGQDGNTTRTFTWQTPVTDKGALRYRRLNVKKILGETFQYTTGTDYYKLANQQLNRILRVVATVQTKDTLQRGGSDGLIANPDKLFNSNIVSIISVSQTITNTDGTTTTTNYVADTDYKYANNAIDWSLSGAEPAVKSTYDVVYTYTRNLVIDEDVTFAYKDDYYQLWFLNPTIKPVNGTTFNVDYRIYSGNLTDWTTVKTDKTFLAHPDVDVTIHRAIIRNLNPSTTYVYQAGYEGHWSDEYELDIIDANDPNRPIEIVWFTDQQGWNDWEYSAWGRVNDYVEKHESYDFIIDTGDISQNGSRSFEWREYYDVSKQNMSTHVQMTCVGNNDLVSKKYSIAYTYYTTVENSPYPSVYSFNYGNIHFIALDSNTGLVDDQGNPLRGNAEQIAFLQDDLDFTKHPENNKRWTILIMHESPYTIVRGSQASAKLWEFINPFFDLGVDLVLNGHHHCYTRSNRMGKITYDTNGVIKDNLDIDNGVYYLMSQASGFKLSGKTKVANPAPWRAFYEKPQHPCYGKFVITNDSIEFVEYRLTNIKTTDIYGNDVVITTGDVVPSYLDSLTIIPKKKNPNPTLN